MNLKKILVAFLLLFGLSSFVFGVSDADMNKIAAGHSFAEHAESDYGVTDKAKWLAKIKDTVSNATKKRSSGNKEFYWKKDTSMFVVYNPGDSDKGTAFKATLVYFNNAQ